MHHRFIPVILIVLLLSATLLAGCTSTTTGRDPSIPVTETIVRDNSPAIYGNPTIPATTGAARKESIAEQLASVQTTNPIFLEAYRMFRNTKSTEYVHPPYTDDDAAGIYKFDCLGFVDHVLMNATMESYKTIGKGVNPSIESYSTFFYQLDSTKPNEIGWIKVTRPLELKPGDICLWLKPSSLDTGHMWIIAGTPSVNPKRADEVLVRIFDSSIAHSDDSRTSSAFRTGLGSGILGYMVDTQGNPVGLYWEGGVSTSAGERDTTIVCGRLNR